MPGAGAPRRVRTALPDSESHLRLQPFEQRRTLALERVSIDGVVFSRPNALSSGIARAEGRCRRHLLCRRFIHPIGSRRLLRAKPEFPPSGYGLLPVPGDAGAVAPRLL